MEQMNKLVVETPSFTGKVLVFASLHTCVIILSGSVESHVVPQLRDKVRAATSGSKHDYVVDMDEVTYISSNGLGFLMYLAKNRRDFVLLSKPGPAVLKPLDLLGIQHLFRYYQSMEDLEKQPGVPAEVLSPLWMEKKVLAASLHQKQWVKILKDHLAAKELTREIQGMSSYLEAADRQDSIVLPADEKYASVLYKFLDRAFGQAAEHGGNTVDAPTIEIIARELMANAVKHGYGFKSGGKVEVGFSLDRSALEITFTDHGRGYSPDSPDDDTLPPAGLEMLRGFFDILDIGHAPQKLADGLVLGKGTTVRMVKRLEPGAGRPAGARPSWWRRLRERFRGRSAR
jgi:anti-anti-sigma factor